MNPCGGCSCKVSCSAEPACAKGIVEAEASPLASGDDVADCPDPGDKFNDAGSGDPAGVIV